MMGMVKNAAAAAALMIDHVSKPLPLDDCGTPPTPVADEAALPLPLDVVISATGTNWPDFLLKTKRKILLFMMNLYEKYGVRYAMKVVRVMRLEGKAKA
jgi:hypothetical protein